MTRKVVNFCVAMQVYFIAVCIRGSCWNASDKFGWRCLRKLVPLSQDSMGRIDNNIITCEEK